MEYIWLDAKKNFRSKTKVLEHPDTPELKYADFPVWSFDGSSTGQAEGNDSEVFLCPVLVAPDPFRKIVNSHCFLVLCDLWNADETPHRDNTRDKARKILEAAEEHEPWFGLEQEFFMQKVNGTSISRLPIGMPPSGKQGQYYCGVGAGNCFGREMIEEALKNLLHASIYITGLNFEVAPGQCEFQVRNIGLKAGDELLMLRYILCRTAEKYNIHINFDPKPVTGDWNGSGCHTNYSTKEMREDGGMQHILSAIGKLKKKHKEHLEVYGDGNERRLTGKHEAPPMDIFSYGIADRGASVRIPRDTDRNRCGYLEDRRPASNMDPYLVLSKIVETTLLDSNKGLGDLGEVGDA